MVCFPLRVELSLENQFSNAPRVHQGSWTEVRASLPVHVTKVLMFCASQEEKGDPVPEPSWPENGDQWSDGGDGGEMEESVLIQEMVEEDEEIDLYNEETFGLGQIASHVLLQHPTLAATIFEIWCDLPLQIIRCLTRLF